MSNKMYQDQSLHRADTDLRNTCRVKFYLNAHYNQTLTKYIKISHFAEADTGLGNILRVKVYLSAYCNQTQKREY